MILSIRITRQQKQALLTIYPSVKYLIEKTIKDITDKIITEGEQSDIERDIKEYRERRELNSYDIRKRKMTQDTKDKISKSLKAKGYKGIPLFEETKKAIGLANIGKHFGPNLKARGKKRTEEQRKNISLGKMGTKYKKRAKVELN
jgi:hypothetical protein